MLKKTFVNKKKNQKSVKIHFKSKFFWKNKILRKLQVKENQFFIKTFLKFFPFAKYLLCQKQ